MDTTNKPVAWINREEGSGSILDWEKDPYSEVNIPLYTHPVKELTDEEIEEIGKQYLSAHAQFIGAGECHYEGEIDFARAILRKAQEK